MAYTISDDCIACGVCASECKDDAISDEGSKYGIDAAKCTDCGTCSESCPVGAISQG